MMTRAVVAEERESGIRKWNGWERKKWGGIVRNLCNNRRKRDISMTMLYVKYNQKGFRELQFPSTSSPPILLSHCPLKWDPVDEEARRGGRGEGGEEKSEIRERERERWIEGGWRYIYIYMFARVVECCNVATKENSQWKC